MIIVTAGSDFVDIDAYGGCVSYAELLQKQGIDAKALSTAPLNESITPTVLSWGADFDDKYKPNPEDNFVVIDVSNPEFFEKSLVQDRIIGIIDHHTGHED